MFNVKKFYVRASVGILLNNSIITLVIIQCVQNMMEPIYNNTSFITLHLKLSDYCATECLRLFIHYEKQIQSLFRTEPNPYE